MASTGVDATATDTGVWSVEDPEEEKYNFSSEKGVWEPKPEDILSLFEKLANGQPLPIRWQCPGRRLPKSKEEEIVEDVKEETTEVEDEKEKEDKEAAPEMKAFEFDEQTVGPNTKLTPKRAPGGHGRTPRTEKRVARMDNIMDSMRRRQQEEREARKARAAQAGTPRRPDQKLNSPGQTVVASSNTQVVTSSAFTTSLSLPLPNANLIATSTFAMSVASAVIPTLPSSVITSLAEASLSTTNTQASVSTENTQASYLPPIVPTLQTSSQAHSSTTLSTESIKTTPVNTTTSSIEKHVHSNSTFSSQPVSTIADTSISSNTTTLIMSTAAVNPQVLVPVISSTNTPVTMIPSKACSAEELTNINNQTNEIQLPCTISNSNQTSLHDRPVVASTQGLQFSSLAKKDTQPNISSPVSAPVSEVKLTSDTTASTTVEKETIISSNTSAITLLSSVTQNPITSNLSDIIVTEASQETINIKNIEGTNAPITTNVPQFPIQTSTTPSSDHSESSVTTSANTAASTITSTASIETTLPNTSTPCDQNPILAVPLVSVEVSSSTAVVTSEQTLSPAPSNAAETNLATE